MPTASPLALYWHYLAHHRETFGSEWIISKFTAKASDMPQQVVSTVSLITIKNIDYMNSKSRSSTTHLLGVLALSVSFIQLFQSALIQIPEFRKKSLHFHLRFLLAGGMTASDSIGSSRMSWTRRRIPPRIHLVRNSPLCERIPIQTGNIYRKLSTIQVHSFFVDLSAKDAMRNRK